MTFQFADQLAIGQQYETIIDAYIGDALGYEIEPVSMELQRLGIDRIWTGPDGSRFTVEYKTDLHTNGKAFLETVENDQRGTPGWIYKATANLLVYFFPNMDVLYILDLMDLKRKLPDLTAGKLPLPARHQNYRSWGIPVSFQDLQASLTSCDMHRL